MRDDPAASRDCDRLPRLSPVEQPAESVLGLERADLPHYRFVQIVG
jgi:hypothetical protein